MPVLVKPLDGQNEAIKQVLTVNGLLSKRGHHGTLSLFPNTCLLLILAVKNCLGAVSLPPGTDTPNPVRNERVRGQ